MKQLSRLAPAAVMKWGFIQTTCTTIYLQESFPSITKKAEISIPKIEDRIGELNARNPTLLPVGETANGQWISIENKRKKNLKIRSKYRFGCLNHPRFRDFRSRHLCDCLFHSEGRSFQ